MRLTPITPAIRAASIGFPFRVPATRCSTASGVIVTTHSAVASRCVTSFSPTSTIRARLHPQSSEERKTMTRTSEPAGAVAVPTGTIARPFARTTVEMRLEPRRPVGVAVHPSAGSLQSDPRELQLALRPLDVLGEGGRHLRAVELRAAHHLEDRRAYEDLEAHEDAHRVAGQAEVRLALDLPEPLRHARLHRHLVELHLTAAEERRLHHVAFADGDPARGDERVGLDQVAEDGLLQRVDVVLHDASQDRLRAHIAERGEDHVRVRVSDLPELGRLRRRDQLVAGRQDDHPRSWMDVRVGEPGVRQESHLRRPEALARRDQDLARLHVLA